MSVQLWQLSTLFPFHLLRQVGAPWTGLLLSIIPDLGGQVLGTCLAHAVLGKVEGLEVRLAQTCSPGLQQAVGWGCSCCGWEQWSVEQTGLGETMLWLLA